MFRFGHSIHKCVWLRPTQLCSVSKRFQSTLMDSNANEVANQKAKTSVQPIIDSLTVFDRNIKKMQRARALETPEKALQYGYLRREVAERLVTRVEFIKRDFPTVCDMSYGGGEVSDVLSRFATEKKIKTVIQMDTVPNAFHEKKMGEFENVYHINGDEEFLPLKENSYDLIISSMNMHWVNKLPSVMRNIKNALKKDGCFLIAMLGGESLQELRSSFALADLERFGGVLPHISPFAGQKDLGDVMFEAGFNLVTLDNEQIKVRYPDMFTLMDHLQSMGENNAIANRNETGFFSSRDSMIAAAAAYHELYRDKDDLLENTFHVLYGIGWKPDESQPKALPKGSALHRFKELQE